MFGVHSPWRQSIIRSQVTIKSFFGGNGIEKEVLGRSKFNGVEPKIMMHSFCRAGYVVFGFGNIQSSNCQALFSPGEYSSGQSQCLSRQIFFPCHTMTEHLLLCWKHFFYTCRNALSWILELWCVWPAPESRLCSSPLCFQ